MGAPNSRLIGMAVDAPNWMSGSNRDRQSHGPWLVVTHAVLRLGLLLSVVGPDGTGCPLLFVATYGHGCLSLSTPGDGFMLLMLFTALLLSV